jgi:splicing factor 3B subunit 2
VKEKTPGLLSSELKAALGMTDMSPPPWLINMQRYGPPPSYPSMRIPGLNAPIPPGAQFGYQPGQWGKPPVDEYGRPLYGDVFGVLPEEEDTGNDGVDKITKWGELMFFDTQSESEGDEGDAEGDAKPRVAKTDRVTSSGLDTPFTQDGMSSVHTGVLTPGVIDLRKRAGGLETPDSVYGGGNRELYQVVQERNLQGGTVGQLFGSDRTYVLPGGNDSETDTHEAQDRQDINVEGDDGDETKGKRKRRLDSSNIAKKYKDFKF